VAETYVEYLVIPKSQIDHRLLSKAHLEDVKGALHSLSTRISSGRTGCT